MTGIALGGSTQGAGYILTVSDLAPQYSSVIFSISNSLASLPGALAPSVVGAMTPQVSVYGWTSDVCGKVLFKFCRGLLRNRVKHLQIVFSPLCIVKKNFDPHHMDVEGLMEKRKNIYMKKLLQNFQSARNILFRQMSIQSTTNTCQIIHLHACICSLLEYVAFYCTNILIWLPSSYVVEYPLFFAFSLKLF